MALTTSHQVSGTHQPAYNDNLWVVQETSTGITSNYNFKFICDVKNTTDSLLTRLKVPLYYGSNNRGVFNISRVLESYVTHDWDYTDSAASGCTNSFFDYKLEFGYEYSTGTTSAIVQTLAETTVTGNTIWNAALAPYTFLNYDQANYLMASGSTAGFLTNNASKRIYRNQKDWLYALHDGTLDHLLVTFSDSSTVNIPATSDDMVRFPIGSNISGGIPTGATSYTIRPEDSSNNLVGSAYTITIDERCSKYDAVDVFFLNRMGAVESFRFNKVRRDNFSIDRRMFRQNPYTLDGQNYAYTNQSFNNSQYYTESQQRITLNSDFITEAESVWLRELVMSPRVWLYDDALYTVNIMDTEYEQRYHINDKAFNLTIEAELSFPDKVQRL